MEFRVDDGPARPMRLALNDRMNLAPVQVEHAHGDGMRRPV